MVESSSIYVCANCYSALPTIDQKTTLLAFVECECRNCGERNLLPLLKAAFAFYWLIGIICSIQIAALLLGNLTGIYTGLIGPSIGASIVGAIGCLILLRKDRELKAKYKQLAAKIEQDKARMRIGRDGFTELMFAAGAGDYERVCQLIESEKNPNAQDINGATALMYAVKGNHGSTVEYLVDMGADPLIKTNKGKTAIDFANTVDKSVLRYLLQVTK